MSTLSFAGPAPLSAPPVGQSFAVTALLMEDALPGDALPAKHAVDQPNQVAPFGNPLLDGKQEALFIDDKNGLNYLFRAETTGWAYQAVLDEKHAQIPAAEVVTVVSDVDLGVRAVVVDEAGNVSAFQLVPNRNLGPAPKPDAPRFVWTRISVLPDTRSEPFIPRVRRLSVAYEGRKPVVTGLADKGAIQRFECGGSASVPVVLWMSADTIAFAIDKFATVASVTSKSDLIAFGLRNTPIKEPLVKRKGDTVPVQIAAEVNQLVGAFRGQHGNVYGCLYLDDSGSLVVWWSESSPSKPMGTRRVAGLSLTKAVLWTDAAGMMHVYGRDHDHALRALRQAGWSLDGDPVWAYGLVKDTGRQTTLAVGIQPEIIDFAVDSYPDAVSSQFVARAETSAENRYVVCSQDVTNARWSTEAVRLPVSADRAPNRVTNYVIDVTLLDAYGVPAPGKQVTVGADALVEIAVGDISHLVGDGHEAVVQLDGAGKTSIAMPAHSLLPPALTITAVGATANVVVQPAADVHNFLGGSGTLPSQTGRFNADGLMSATDGSGNRIAPDRKSVV